MRNDNTKVQIIELSEKPIQYESIGSKEKVWFTNPRRLFKVGTADTGENWSEYVTSLLAKEIELPSVEYQLAVWEGKMGTICRSMVEDDILIHGNEILSVLHSDYPRNTSPGAIKISKYTLPKVLNCNNHNKLNIPLNFRATTPIVNAIDIFIGYLLFDTWIGNTDRHHQNWAWILHSNNRTFHLAPTFDHASSLGRELLDEKKR